MKKYLLLIAFMLMFVVLGCGSITINDTMKPPSITEEAQQYSSIKKVAVLPFDNLSKRKDAEKTISAFFTTELMKRRVFDSIEDPRYVANTMKQLKIKRTEMLDRDIVLKMGDSMKCEAIIVGNIDSYEVGKKDESTDISISTTMFDTRSGDILWSASCTNSSSTSLGKIFGVTPGPNHIEMTNDVIIKLISSLESAVKKGRAEEAEMEADKSQLESATGETADEGKETPEITPPEASGDTGDAGAPPAGDEPPAEPPPPEEQPPAEPPPPEEPPPEQ